MLLQRGRFENYMVIDLTSGKKIFLCVPVSLLFLCPKAQGDPSEEAVLEAGAGEAVHCPEAGPESGGDLVTESGGQQHGQSQAEDREAVCQRIRGQGKPGHHDEDMREVVGDQESDGGPREAADGAQDLGDQVSDGGHEAGQLGQEAGHTALEPLDEGLSLLSLANVLYSRAVSRLVLGCGLGSSLANSGSLGLAILEDSLLGNRRGDLGDLLDGDSVTIDMGSVHSISSDLGLD